MTSPRIMLLPTFNSKKPNLSSNKMSSETSEAWAIANGSRILPKLLKNLVIPNFKLDAH